MEIFSNEFKAELSNQLEALTNVVKTDKPNPISDYEIIKSMEDCIARLEEELKLKKEKNKKKKQFEVGDVVYLGNLKGNVANQYNDESDCSLIIDFENGEDLALTKDGRFYQNTPIVISHFPYKLKMKKIK